MLQLRQPVLQEDCFWERVRTGNTISFPSSTLTFAKTSVEHVFGFLWCWTGSDPEAKHKPRDGGYLQRERMECLESGTHAGHSLNTTLQTEERGTKGVQVLLKTDLTIPPSSSHYLFQSKGSAGCSFSTGCQTVTVLLEGLLW